MPSEEERKKQENEETGKDKELVSSIVIFTASGDAIYDSATAAKAEEKEDRSFKRIWKFLKSKKGISALTLFVVAVYTAVTIGMYRANKKSAEAAESASKTAASSLKQTIESFRTDERTWIEIDRIEQAEVATRNGKFGASFRYRIYLKNTGKTSAHGIEVSAPRSWLGSIRLENDADGMRRTQDIILLNRSPKTGPGPVQNPVPKVLAPGATAVVPFVVDGQEPQIFSKDEWVSFVLGRVDYTDAFNIIHWMKFCFYVGESNGQLWNCHDGNDEDSNPEVPP